MMDIFIKIPPHYFIKDFVRRHIQTTLKLVIPK